MTRQLLATLAGFSAVLMWALLALFTVVSGKVPAFQLTAMTFLIAGLLGALSWLFRPRAALVLFRQNWRVWLVGVGGLFGYHFFYYTALRLAPPVQTGLINYLWPLMIVLFSAFLPGERLRWYHGAGAFMGLVGTFLIVTGGRGLAVDPAYVDGYCTALLCAFFWTGYSLISRRLSKVPTDMVVGFCFVTAILSIFAHLAFEETIWPQNWIEWSGVLGLGLMPVGLAFYAWDFGVKQGNIQILGASAYAAPLLSTIILIVSGYGKFSWNILLAALLITFGAVLASKDMFGLLFKKKKNAPISPDLPVVDPVSGD